MYRVFKIRYRLIALITTLNLILPFILFISFIILVGHIASDVSYNEMMESIISNDINVVIENKEICMSTAGHVSKIKSGSILCLSMSMKCSVFVNIYAKNPFFP